MKTLLIGGALALALIQITAAGAGKPGFSARVDNPWFPLRPGTTYVYRGTKDGQPLRQVTTVTHRTKLVDGVPCRVVDDRVWLSGVLQERTADWYTQDRRDNVWYYGEATAELDRQGRVTTTEGSWRSGRDGAKPGIFMPAHPRVGQSFREEYYKGHAEDHFRILSLHAKVEVPYISSRRGLLTKEWTPLEPRVRDQKVYLRGIGLVSERSVAGPTERSELVSVKR